ncbi:MAG: hypothetical protein QUV18_13680 [Roseovarius sp.]|nr:hypothetical protein [Roseovarius sp.]
MTRKQNPTIQLPRERIEQLRQFGQATSTSTMSEIVGSLLKLARQQGLVEHGIPGINVKVNVLADGLAIRFPNSPTAGFSFDAASKIADTIREYLDGQHAGEKNAHLTDPDTHANSFAIWRRGNSIKIAIPMNAPEKNFTHDLAEEFADLLDNAVARSKIAH